MSHKCARIRIERYEFLVDGAWKTLRGLGGRLGDGCLERRDNASLEITKTHLLVRARKDYGAKVTDVRAVLAGTSNSNGAGDS